MENQNQESGTEQQTINIQVPSSDNIASRRSLIPLLFAAVIIFFFFNFFTVSCGGQKVGSVTGINLVTGTELKDRDMFSGRETKGEKIPSNAWAIIAFGAAIVGLGAFLIKEKREALIGTGAGAIGFGSLLILQFTIKSAIEKKAEGAIQIDFQFAYWAALIAMGIAGFISYLRMQKTYNIGVKVSPQVTNSPQVEENLSQTQTTANPVSQTSNFDTSEWLGKNKKVIIGVLSAVIVLYGVYYFFLRHDPVKDAKKSAVAYCDCSTKYNDAMIKVNEEFVKSFESYDFKKRQEARNKLQELQNSVNTENVTCHSAAQQKYTELRNRYVAEQEMLSKFDFAYNAQSGMCNPSNQSKLSSLYTEVENKITSIKDPLPDIEKIKADLLGHKIMTWNFDALTEFNQASILKTTEGSDLTEYHIKLHLVGYTNPTTDIHDAEILVTYIQSSDGWYLNDVKPIYYTQNYTAKVNEWTSISFRDFPKVSYTIIDNGQKFWIQDGSYGTKYKGGPGGDQYHLSSNEIYVMSREDNPVTLVFKFTQTN
ncbi:MAG TPA: hypothetical protein GXZ87_00785 [Bacteroidales bacterium]|nr:hypothetical protein [Bacteroidales bacterium]